MRLYEMNLDIAKKEREALTGGKESAQSHHNISNNAVAKASKGKVAFANSHAERESQKEVMGGEEETIREEDQLIDEQTRLLRDKIRVIDHMEAKSRTWEQI